MKIGSCTGLSGLEWAAKAGCDYVEPGFASVTQMEEGEYRSLQAALAACGLPAEAMNGFLPGSFALCEPGPWDPVKAFVEKGMKRARELGVKVVVFGSAGARKVPEGMDQEAALDRLADFCRLAGDIAGCHDITIAIEPLCYAESNVINTFAQGLELARRAHHPRVRCLADLYHMGVNGEKLTDLLQGGEALAHCHIAWPGKRTYPLPSDGYDYTAFFDPLKAMGYTGRVSVEASPVQGPEDLIASVAYLRELAR